MGGLSSLAGNLTGGIIGTSDAEAAVPGIKQLSEESKKDILAELDMSWDDMQGFMQPYLDVGKTALSEYKQSIGAAPNAPVFENFEFDASKLEDNPAYKFVRDQGLQAVDRLQARNRGLTSGNRMAAITDYATGLASTEYGNEFQRQLQTYGANTQAKNLNYNVNRNKMGDLRDMVGIGVNTAGNMSSFRSNLASQRAGAHSNYAAEQTAADLIPVQEKQNFVNNLISAGGFMAGAAMGKPA